MIWSILYGNSSHHSKMFSKVLQWDFEEFCYKLSIQHQIISYQQFIHCNSIFACLSVVIVPHENFSLNITNERLQIFDLCSALLAIGQWGFFKVPRIFWRGASVSNGHLRVPVTLTLIAERLAVTTCLYDLGLSRLGFEQPTLRLRGQRSNPLCHRRGNSVLEIGSSMMNSNMIRLFK